VKKKGSRSIDQNKPGTSPSFLQTRKPGRHGETQQAIASIVKNLPKGTHLTAPEVYEKAKELGLNISLSTVYRTLHRLKIVGNVMTVTGDRGLRYETKEEGPEHDHLICIGCGLTVEFIDELIRDFGKNVAQRKGFIHASSRFDILGYCANCRSKNEYHKSQDILERLQTVFEKLNRVREILKNIIEVPNHDDLSEIFDLTQSAVAKLESSLDEAKDSLDRLF